MRKAALLSTVAATLLLTAGAVSAQSPKPEGAAPAPAAQQNAPAEKVAPAMKPGEKKAGTEQKAPSTVGQAPAPKASDADKTRATDKGAMEKNANEKGAMDTKASDKGAAKPDEKAAQGAPGAKANDTKASETKSAPAATTGQGAAAGSAKLSTEQRTKISAVFKQHRVEPAHLNVSINVGTRITENVHFYPIPTEVVVIYPEWRGYDYILVGDRIIVVDPRSHEIVAILDA